MTSRFYAGRVLSKETIGAWIHDNREARGWSQAYLGAKVGTSNNVVSRWERGKNAPRAETVQALAAIFGVEAPVETEALEDPAETREVGRRLSVLEEALAELTAIIQRGPRPSDREALEDLTRRLRAERDDPGWLAHKADIEARRAEGVLEEADRHGEPPRSGTAGPLPRTVPRRRVADG